MLVSELTIEDFRGLDRMTLSGMQRLTLITGRNNAGKSSIIESLFLLLNITSPSVFMKLNGFRSRFPVSDADDLWGYLFRDKDSHSIRIQAVIDGCNAVLEIRRADDGSVFYADPRVPPDGMKLSGSGLAAMGSGARIEYDLTYNNEIRSDAYQLGLNQIRSEKAMSSESAFLPDYRAVFVPALRGGSTDLAEPLGELELGNYKGALVSALQRMDPEIRDIFTVVRQGRSEVFVRRVSGTPLPLLLAGDGIRNLAMMCTYILTTPNGLVLIDEIENGLHHQLYGPVWDIILQLAEDHNAQVIATTHSKEFLECAAAITIEKNATDLFRAFRLQRASWGSRAYSYSAEDIQLALDSGIEVR